MRSDHLPAGACVLISRALRLAAGVSRGDARVQCLVLARMFERAHAGLHLLSASAEVPTWMDGCRPVRWPSMEGEADGR